MFEILKKANEESLKKSKEKQARIDAAGGWDAMVKQANKSPQKLFKEQMAEFDRLSKLK